MAMDLFEHSAHHSRSSLIATPLAELLRPKSLDDMVGQSHVLGKDKALYKILKNGNLPSMIIWGPPGCGKTSFAELLAKMFEGEFISLNAISTGAKAIREEGQKAHERRIHYNKKSIVFIDEIHRLNKSQQDVLLPFVEKGDIVLIGATTENPSFEVNSALLSRSRLVVFKDLNETDIDTLIKKAFQAKKIVSTEILSPKAQNVLVKLANGDGRRAINLSEQIIFFYEACIAGAQSDVDWPLSDENLEEALPGMSLYYNKDDEHYDTISAFIKSIRGSDPDAGLYYLARMIKGGEDPKFIARRLVVLASEDVGNADPRALSIAVAGLQAVEFVGLPEAAINLGQVVCYLASAPKSNRSYLGIKKALAEVERSGNLEIPKAVRNAPTKIMKNLGYGEGYQYAHDGKKGWKQEQFLPDEIKGTVYYEPVERGFEKNIIEYRKWLKS